MPGAARTWKEKEVPAPDSLQSPVQGSNRWAQTDTRGSTGDNETMLVCVTSRGLGTLVGRIKPK